MNHGMYISASGALTSMHRLDALTNNLANVNTAGFKPHAPAVRQRDVARIEDDLPFADSNAMLERLGGGVQLAHTRISFSQGALQQTGNPLDVGIQGDGFLMIRGDMSGNEAELHLTRDGRMTLSANGTIVQGTTGRPVLGVGNQPIRVDPSKTLTIDGDGTVKQDGISIGRLRFVDVPDRQRLTKAGDGLFSLSADALEGLRPADGRIVQGELESSSVDEIRALMQVQAAAGDARSNLAMIDYHDRLMDRAINRLGRTT